MTAPPAAPSDALLPCPFCGFDTCISHPPSHSGLVLARVQCPSCETIGPEVPTEDAAIAAWNTRAAIVAHAPPREPTTAMLCPHGKNRDITNCYACIGEEDKATRTPAPPDNLVRRLRDDADLIERRSRPPHRVMAMNHYREAADAIEARDRRIAELSETANNEQRARLQADVAYMQAEARAEAMRVALAELVAAMDALLAMPEAGTGHQTFVIPSAASIRMAHASAAARAALVDGK